MHPNAALVEGFYRSFQARDGAAMARCYAEDVVFCDPVFPRLEGARAGAMWRMLCARATDLELTWEGVAADERAGSARWRARYTFRQTGRRVENRIEASFTFRDGLIVRHDDVFDFWRWSRQALGVPGVLLGWTPVLRGKVQSQAAQALDAFVAAG